MSFAFTLYTFLVWREKRAERLRTAPPTGRLSAYRGTLPSQKNAGGRAPITRSAAAYGTFAFAMLVPIEFLVDRMAARMARRMAPRGAPLPFVPAWRTGAWLRRGDPKAENEVDRLYRLQILVNLFLMVGLGVFATAASATHPVLLVTLAVLLAMRAFHTRLLGKVAKSFDPAADRIPGILESQPNDKDKEEEVPPWLSRALTRRAENRLGATPLGSARPLPPDRSSEPAQVRIANPPSSKAEPLDEEEGEELAEPEPKARAKNL